VNTNTVFYPEERGSKFIRKVGICLLQDVTSENNNLQAPSDEFSNFQTVKLNSLVLLNTGSSP